MIVLGSPLGPMSCLTIDSHSNGVKYVLHLVDEDLNPIRKWLDTPIVFMPLSHQWACLGRPICLCVGGVVDLLVVAVVVCNNVSLYSPGLPGMTRTALKLGETCLPLTLK